MTGAAAGSVLVPIDGSHHSYRALRHALDTFPEASVTALHVVDLFEPDRGVGSGGGSVYEPPMGSKAWYERAEAASSEILEEAERIADARGRELATISEIGDPERLIVEIADEEEIDHVVMGTHGRPEGKRPVYGSTADAVARRAPVSVTLVR